MKALQYSRQNGSSHGLPYAIKNAEMSSTWSDQALQSEDTGLIVIDEDYTVKLWNRFMVNHSGIKPNEILNQNLFALFKEFDDGWFKDKCQLSISVKQGVYITWLERPYAFCFPINNSIESQAEFMYQNISIIPTTLDGELKKHICISIYDVTDSAMKYNSLRMMTPRMFTV